MNALLTMEGSKFRLFMNENRDWMQTMIRQRKEIPLLEKMLDSAPQEKKSERTKLEDHFCRQLMMQLKEMKQLNRELSDQQKRLEKDCENETEGRYDIDALCIQEILRERIKAIEKNYIDLKCNFMKFISSLL